MRVTTIKKSMRAQNVKQRDQLILRLWRNTSSSGLKINILAHSNRLFIYHSKKATLVLSKIY